MTFLLLQTFLLLLSSYFLGAFVACLIKRTLAAREAVAVPAGAPAVRAPAPIAAPAPVAPVVARPVDLVQPKIEVLPRPEPRPAPAMPDTTRFDRALMGASVTSDVPRKPVVEIRPAVLKSPTARPLRSAPAPAQMPAQPAAAQLKPAAPVTPPAPARAPETARPQAPPAPATQPASATAANAAAAAAAAMAAARAAASAAQAAQPQVKPAAPQQPQAVQQPAPARSVPEVPRQSALTAKPEVTAPIAQSEPAKPAAAPAGADDLQRIRAIDEDTERRLKSAGIVRFEQMARWTAADVGKVAQGLGIGDRIDREQWIEQAQILAMGGETYYSRNRAAAQRPQGQQTVIPPAPAPQKAPTSPQGSPGATAAAAAAAAAMANKSQAQTITPVPSPAPPAAAPQPQPPVQQAEPAPKASTQPTSPAAAAPQRSVSEMALAAAAAIAAASASVTRGIKPIEQISPLSKADPNLSLPAKLSDAIKEQETKTTASASAPPPRHDLSHLRSVKSESLRTAGDVDLKRIRGIGVLIEKRLHALGITSYGQIANWTSQDIDRISQMLDFKGRIERENWVEQARILSSGGHTEFSRRVDKGEVETSRDDD